MHSPKSSIKTYFCSASSSWPEPARSLRLRPSPVGSVFLLLSAVILWVTGKEGWGIGAQAEPCVAVSNSSVSGGLQQLTVNKDTTFNLSTLFACEDGEFNVSWSGIVKVYSTIKIGNRTIVRISGETTAGSISNSSISGSSSDGSNSNSSSSSNSSGVDLEFELERLSSGLNLPQGLTSEVVGVFSTVLFGPIFFVDGG